ncbi:Hsp20/alpha crystallin family protein [bacterium]|jgi:HSP20 family protein|nr:Hsp20/alpha crystallin family protein [bacterium]
MIESGAGSAGPAGSVEPKRPVCQPHVDIHESETGLILRADLPGVTKETLELVIEENVLKIFGRSTVAMPAGTLRAHDEFRMGDFYRSFILSDELDTDNIKAELENGVLNLRLPKKKVRPRRIEVE